MEESPADFAFRRKEAKERLNAQGIYTLTTWQFLVQLHLLKYSCRCVAEIDPRGYEEARQLINDGRMVFMPGPNCNKGTPFKPTPKGLIARQINDLCDRARPLGLS
jgi:hypothetical protein